MELNVTAAPCMAQLQKKISQNNFLHKILKSKSVKINLNDQLRHDSFQKNHKKHKKYHMQFCNIQILSKLWNSKKHQTVTLQK